MKETVNCVRDGLQAALSARNSRLSIELPPGTPLALVGDDTGEWWRAPPKEREKVLVGDRALADTVCLLFPSGFAVSCVYVAPDAAELAVKANKKKGRAAECVALPSQTAAKGPNLKKGFSPKKAPARGFGAGAGATKAGLWNAALGLRERADVVLIVGTLDSESARVVGEAASALGDETAFVLLNSRLESLSAYAPVRADVDPALFESFVSAFALSPPPPPTDSADDSWRGLIAARTFPEQWLVARPRQLGGGVVEVWRGDAPPKPVDTALALATATDDPLENVKKLFRR